MYIFAYTLKREREIIVIIIMIIIHGLRVGLSVHAVC